MPPVIAQIKHIRELRARLDLARDLQLGVIQPLKFGSELIVREADPTTVTELKLMQMRQIPARKAASIACANCSNVCDGPTIITRPGGGSRSLPRPPTRSTRILNQVRATPRSLPTLKPSSVDSL